MGASVSEKSEVLKDRISELPDEILSFTLSLLPVREAARTSILSCRWRYPWKASRSTLSLSALDMRGSEYPEGMLVAFDEKCMYREVTDLLKIERSKFIEWVDKMMQLDYLPVLDSFRLRFHLKKNYAVYIDQWIKKAIEKRVQKFDIDLSRFHKWDTFPNTSFYTFPDGLFTGMLVKSLCLKSCILEPSSFNRFGSLLDLQLNNVLLDKDKFHSFLLNCPNLEKLCLVSCMDIFKLEIKGTHLQLKFLTIINCSGIMEIEIDAKHLTRFEYRGKLPNFCNLKVPELSHAIFRLGGLNNSSVVENIFNEVPKLESLMLAFGTSKESIIPNYHFANLKKLELTLLMCRVSLWKLTPLIRSAPYLCNLELNWTLSPSECETELAPEAFDSPHCHLKKILLTGFNASDHELEFARYLLNNAAALEEISISFNLKGYTYEHGYKFREAINKPDENKVRQQIIDVMPRGAKFFIL